MVSKKNVDLLLTLVRKWQRESDPDKARAYCCQAKTLSEQIAAGTQFQNSDLVAGNIFFSTAWLVADKRWTNRQMYIILERNGVTIDGLIL